MRVYDIFPFPFAAVQEIFENFPSLGWPTDRKSSILTKIASLKGVKSEKMDYFNGHPTHRYISVLIATVSFLCPFHSLSHSITFVIYEYFKFSFAL
jgi:hypothetical protein